MLITLLVLALMVGLVYYVITNVGLPPQVQKVATVILVVVACLYLISLIAPGAVGSLGM